MGVPRPSCRSGTRPWLWRRVFRGRQERLDSRKKRMATNRTDEETSEKARVEAMKPGANPWERGWAV